MNEVPPVKRPRRCISSYRRNSFQSSSPAASESLPSPSSPAPSESFSNGDSFSNSNSEANFFFCDGEETKSVGGRKRLRRNRIILDEDFTCILTTRREISLAIYGIIWQHSKGKRSIAVRKQQ